MSILAFDLGASSGRALIGRLHNGTIEVEELHRFPNDPVQVGSRLQWDILRLLHELKTALVKARQQGIKLESMGIDSWAVDFGLVSEGGDLLGNPYHYRDPHAAGMMEELLERLTPAYIFERTGIQFLPFNTIFQLAALRKAQSPLLREGRHFLMIPDLLRYFLTGVIASEFTNATTTQLYNPIKQQWDSDLLAQIDVPADLFVQPVQPGTHIGYVSERVCEELDIPQVPMYAVAEHDTASAVAAVPALEQSFAYLSCGTWSLLGTEVQEPVMNEAALRYNFTNEGGVYGTYRLLKNIMGLWVLQESRRAWDLAGVHYTFSELVKLAEAATPFAAFIDPDDPLFLPPGDMPERILQYSAQTGQVLSPDPGSITRVILESLALKYRYVFELTEAVSQQDFSGLHMIGGGIQNELLCQWTANAIGKPVWAGPIEGSAIGNLAVQWIATGKFRDIWEARQAIRSSFPIKVYDPKPAVGSVRSWEEAYAAFLEITGLKQDS